MKCSYCGAEMRDDAVLCTACGKLTPSFERTYQRPDPTIGGSGTRASRYDPDVTSSGGAGHARRLLAIVLAAIVAIGVFSLIIGSYLPEETNDSYREAVEEAYTPDECTEVVETYFDAYAESNTKAIRALFAEARRDDALSDYDFNYVMGYTVVEYTVTDVYSHSASDLQFVGKQLGETVDSYIDLEVEVEYAELDESSILFFELVQIDGEWYLYEIW